MNLYFLVEGKRTESKIYPSWIESLFPKISRIFTPKKVSFNNYMLISGNGYPSILNHLLNAIADVNDAGIFDKLIFVVDSEEDGYDTRKSEILNFLKSNNIKIKDINSSFHLIIQNRTIETWLLGNRKTFKRNPSSETLRDYIEFYNVLENDPESCPCHGSHNTHASFHFDYLRCIFNERNLSYSKYRPSVSAV